jgi:hypothetical protein
MAGTKTIGCAILESPKEVSPRYPGIWDRMVTAFHAVQTSWSTLEMEAAEFSETLQLIYPLYGGTSQKAGLISFKMNDSSC